ncbi:MAG TPA: tetratricopeptide repeat protein [Terriglobales bacterium]|nr:tetratricopeptide repeat protein [Terriglobales bacterium]
MKQVDWKSLICRPSVVIASLSIIAILAFLFVNRLVHRFSEQQKALARRMFAQGQLEQRSGRPDQAIEDFRVALSYDRGNFPYQLNLARALRDNNQPEEAKSYLLNLWNRTPDDGAVNLALARLAARQGQIEDAIHYYHNAAYGRWDSDADAKRRNAQFELVDFLLSRNALPQAQAELLNLSTTLPAASEDLRLRLAQLFARAQDYEHALAEYQRVLAHHREDGSALAGAGESAFRLGRYRTAEDYLSSALRINPKENPEDEQVRQLHETSNMVLQSDPYERKLPASERKARIRDAFNAAGERLEQCAVSQGVNANAMPPESSSPTASVASTPPANSGPDLASLKKQWVEMKPKLTRSRASDDSDLLDSTMNIVFEIEQATQKQCGPGSHIDQALLLLAQTRSGVDR